MYYKNFTYLICCLSLIFFGCSHEDSISPELKQSNQESVLSKSDLKGKSGATQISGVGSYGDCSGETEEADFALTLTGDLEGCLYVFVENHDCSPSGTYREQGREYFVGTYNGEEGTFETTYRFEAKFAGCEDGFFVGAEIFGRCQHPIVKGSGDGVFEGVTGRLDFKDDIAAGDFPYRGHLKY